MELYISHKNGSPQNAHRTNIDNHLYKLRKVLDISDELHQYANFWDLNCETFNQYNLPNFVKKPACLKNPNKPSEYNCHKNWPL